MAAEMLLQYLWEHRLWPYGGLTTVDGERVEVIDSGRRNTDAGPDFFNAKISIAGKVWAGNVEVHDRASDWHRHGHSTDRAYDSVILHVVGTDDIRISRPDGSLIPQLVLHYVSDYQDRYMKLVYNTALPACRAELASLPSIYLTDWVSSLGYERLYDKVDRVNNILKRLDGDWQATAYVTIARALGFSTNSDPFERLALSTPLRCLLKHCSDMRLPEAALMGQAGFLDVELTDPAERARIEALRTDYAFMIAKYGLTRPQNLGWKMARMRPPNFPHRRIATLLALIADGFSIGRKFAHVETLDQARDLFEIKIEGYWASHYMPGRTSTMGARALSPESIDRLVINAIVPLLYAYGLYYGSDSRTTAAVDILQRMAPEINSVTRIFTDAGIPCDDAFTSQALIQLRRAYCEPHKCLYCRIGHRLLASKTV